MKPEKFIHSTWSNIFFPVMAWLFTGSLILTVIAGLLMLASAAFHWKENEKENMNYQLWKNTIGYIFQKADEIAMFFYFLAGIWYAAHSGDVLGAGGGAITLGYFLAFAAAMAVKHREFGSEAIGVLALVMVGVAAASNLWAFAGLAVFGLALFFGKMAREAHKGASHAAADRLHGLWHLVASIGYGLTLYFV